MEEISAACREQDVGAEQINTGDPAARQGDAAECQCVRADVGDIRGAGSTGRAAAGSIAYFRIEDRRPPPSVAGERREGCAAAARRKENGRIAPELQGVRSISHADDHDKEFVRY